LDNTPFFEEAENKKTQLEQVFASTSDGFLVADLNGRVIASSREGGELMGVATEEVVGRPFQRLVEILRPTVSWEQPGARALLSVIASGRPGDAAGDLEFRSLEARTLGWRAPPIRDPPGALRGVAITFNAVTPHRGVHASTTKVLSNLPHR